MLREIETSIPPRIAEQNLQIPADLTSMAAAADALETLIADFIPPPPDHVPELIDDLIRFCNRDDIPALAQAALAHAQFESIHPFTDDNGRIGRGLIDAPTSSVYSAIKRLTHTIINPSKNSIAGNVNLDQF